MTEVFGTDKGAIFQCDTERCWFVDFAGKFARFDYRNLLKLRKAVYNVDIEHILLNDTKSPDVETAVRSEQPCEGDNCKQVSFADRAPHAPAESR